jgi:hypothetical protein
MKHVTLSSLLERLTYLQQSLDENAARRITLQTLYDECQAAVLERVAVEGFDSLPNVNGAKFTLKTSFHGGFNAEQAKGLFNELATLKLGGKVQALVSRTYEPTSAGEWEALQAAVTPETGYALGLKCHPQTFAKLLRENPTLKPYATFNESTKIVVKGSK